MKAPESRGRVWGRPDPQQWQHRSQERTAREDAERKAAAAEAGVAEERRRRKDLEAKRAAEADTKPQQAADVAAEKVVDS